MQSRSILLKGSKLPMTQKKRTKLIKTVRAILYICAIYCGIFCVLSSPKFIKDLVEYHNYLSSDIDEDLVRDFCQNSSQPERCEIIYLPTNGEHLDYHRWYHLSKMITFNKLRLKGQPESMVEKVYGRADEIRNYSKGENARTYNYYTLPHVFIGQFQIHCRNGVIVSAEPFD